MCNWGTERLLCVPVPAELSYTGRARWAMKGIDACIADLVQALNAAGIYTDQSCCGHGMGPGIIHLQDGRTLLIQAADDGAARCGIDDPAEYRV